MSTEFAWFTSRGDITLPPSLEIDFDSEVELDIVEQSDEFSVDYYMNNSEDKDLLITIHLGKLEKLFSLADRLKAAAELSFCTTCKGAGGIQRYQYESCDDCEGTGKDASSKMDVLWIKTRVGVAFFNEISPFTSNPEVDINVSNEQDGFYLKFRLNLSSNEQSNVTIFLGGLVKVNRFVKEVKRNSGLFELGVKMRAIQIDEYRSILLNKDFKCSKDYPSILERSKDDIYIEIAFRRNLLSSTIIRTVSVSIYKEGPLGKRLFIVEVRAPILDKALSYLLTEKEEIVKQVSEIAHELTIFRENCKKETVDNYWRDF